MEVVNLTNKSGKIKTTAIVDTLRTKLETSLYIAKELVEDNCPGDMAEAERLVRESLEIIKKLRRIEGA